MCELQGSANTIRQELRTGLPDATQVKDQSTDRVCRICAVLEQVVVRFMAHDVLIAPVGFDQALQGVGRDIEYLYRFGQRDEIRVGRTGGVARSGVAVRRVAGVELLLPEFEQCEPVAVCLVSQVVNAARKSVYRVEMAAQVFREET